MLCGFTEVSNHKPEVDNWGSLFVDGLKLLFVTLGYAIAVFILNAVIHGSMNVAAFSERTGTVLSSTESGLFHIIQKRILRGF